MSLLAHTRVGAGPRTVFLLHGFLGSARNLATLARGLAQRRPECSVIALDLTGHGESPPLPPRPDVAVVAGDVLDTARTLAPAAPWTLVGHSLGGRVALRAALLAPAALAHLTLLDVTPSPRAPGGEVAPIVKALADAPDTAPNRDAFRAWFRRAGLPPAAIDWLLLNLVHDGAVYRWRIDRAALAVLYAEIGAEDLWPAVEGRRSYSVHGVRGGKSDYVSDADVRRLEAAGCRVDTVEGAGHFLHVERPAELLDRIVQGLA
ncbi:MAG TPA: alpha/beta hydrolase [Patescibacteria group bacterium]|nr:alpha/beta hydrolase [Patescibacteria group bacterium]